MLNVNSLLYYLIGPPQSFSCQCWCLPDQCTVMWERIPTVSCSSLQFNVSVKGADGTPAYSHSFNQSITCAQTTPLNTSTLYTATITAENVCDSTTCCANCSTVKEKTGWFSLCCFHIFLCRLPYHTIEYFPVTR